MQLSNKNIAGLLSVATGSLLGTGCQTNAIEWDVDSALLIYDETDRVRAVEPVISLKKDLGDDEILSMKIVADALTGASANGAVPSTRAQTFTTPSGGSDDDDDDDDYDDRIANKDDDEGGGTYTIAPNETPLDSTFEDTRLSYSLNWDKPLGRNDRSNLGMNVSLEHDFFSLSGNASWQHDFNQKNTTLTLGVNIELDKIDPIGGTPNPLTNMLLEDKSSGLESREIVDLVIGVTQIINRSSLFQVNYSTSSSDGYMTDPYKFVSVVDNTGEPVSQLFEARPDTRSRQSIYGKYKKMLSSGDIFTTSYRFMTDDWEVESHTLDFTYRYKMSNGYFVQPHLRFYRQTAADFYRYFLLDSESVPEFVSADYRLGELETKTIGLKFGRESDSKHAWSARLEYFLQTGDSTPVEAIGQLTQQDLFPDVEALIVQFNYSIKW